MKDIVESENNKTISFNSPNKESNSYTQSIRPIDPEGGSNYSQMFEPTLPHINKLISRRSTRTKTPSRKAIESKDKDVRKMFGLATQIHPFEAFHPQKQMFAFVKHIQNINQLFDETLNHSHFYNLNAVAETNDVYTPSQMLKLDDI